MSEMLYSFRNDFMDLVKRKPDAVAILTSHDVECEEITYKQLENAVRRCWALFNEMGIAPGASIIAMMPNAVDTLILFYAAMAAGIKYAPIACTATRSEMLRWIDLVKPMVCFVGDLVQHEVVHCLDERRVPCTRVTSDGALAWLPSVEADRSGPSGKVLLGTSGTTGVPKAMVIDGDVLWSSGKAFVNFHELKGQDARFWNYLPVAYLGGLFNLGLIPVAAEGSVLMDEAFSGKTYLTYWQTVQRFNIDTLWLVPTIVRGLVTLGRVVKRRATDVDRYVKRCFLGTAPIDLSTKREFESMFGRPLLENFALSETTFLTSETKSDIASRSEGSTGCSLPYVELSFRKIDNDESGVAAQEILVKTPFMFDGYLGSTGVENKMVDEQGYFATGDIGYLNASGSLVVSGRIRDIIKKGGYFIALREIEIIAEGLGGIREAAAIPVRHDFYGESYVLCIIPEEVGVVDIIDHIGSELRECLAQYRWPEEIKLVQAFPRTASGKIRKTELAELLRLK